jgi:di/tricarboxylate transporter
MLDADLIGGSGSWGIGVGWELIFVLVLLGISLVLFVFERFPIDQVAIAIPVVLLAAGILSPEEAVQGFSNPATVTVGAMLVLSLGLVQTGAVRRLGDWLQTVGTLSPAGRLAVLCVVVSAISPFLNNTPVVLVFLPIFLRVARAHGIPASRVLIPLSYASILGGTVTMIGTSTNLIVYGLAYDRGLTELGMFSISRLGLIYLAAGLLYVLTVGRWLLPHRPSPVDLSSKYEVRRFLTELRVSRRSSAAGRTLRQLRWRDQRGVAVVGITRNEENIWSPGGDQRLLAGDLLLVQADSADLLSLVNEASLVPLVGEEERALHDLDSGDHRLVEILVAPDSPLAGHTLRELRFQQRNWATVLGIQRHEEILRPRLANVRLQPGDLLLISGSPAMLEMLADEEGVVPIGEVQLSSRETPRALVAAAIMLGVVIAAATELLGILPAALIGVVLMLFTKCIRLGDVYQKVDWMVVFLLAGLIPLGTAMEKTGAVEALVGPIASGLEQLGPTGAVAVVYLITWLLTECMSNNAAAVVLTPVALRVAQDTGMNPYALLVAVMFGASASFLTPVGYQTNALVYGPGGYKFRDYVRVGAPLNLLLLVIAMIFIPRFWPS